MSIGFNRRGSALRKRPNLRLGRGELIAIIGALGLAAVAGDYAIRMARRKLGAPVRRAITIGRSREDVYAVWKNFERLPEFMNWVENVEVRGENITHWTVKTPAGVSVEWDAETIEDIPGRRISWRTLPTATVPNRGTVEFVEAPGGRGTEVIVEMQVAAPLGKTIASHEAAGDLRRLKQILELGEIIKSDASIHKAPHAAQPSEGDIQ
jgi:uncharacterized membrane protein